MRSPSPPIESEDLLVTALRAFQDLHWVAYAQLSPDLTVIQASANLLNLLNRPPEEIVGSPLGDVLWEFVGADSALQEVVDGQSAGFKLEYVRRHFPDGSDRYFNFHIVPMNGPHPQPGLLLLAEDATPAGDLHQGLIQDRNELRLAKRELSRLNEELAQLSRMKSLFLSMAAHDLRTPLTSIRGYSTLLLSQASQLPESHQKVLRTISVQSEKLNRLITDLLDVDRIELGQITLNLEECELSAIICEVVESLEAYARDQGKRITLDLSEAPMVLQADGEALWRILYNLVGNAVKYTSQGGEIRIMACQTEDHTVLLVSDNGRGMSETQVANLFQLYYRTEEAAASQVTGTGVGLFIVKTLVQAHGGRIEVESEPGRGTTFCVTLPSFTQP